MSRTVMKHALRHLKILVVLTACIAALGLLANPPFHVQEPERLTYPLSIPLAKYDSFEPSTHVNLTPEFFRIPRIDVVAEVRPVGMVDDRVMEVPQNIKEVGWYFPTAPRNFYAGTTVLVGHRDGKDDPQGVFRNISELDFGDQIQLVDNYGQIHEFNVKSVSTIPDSEFASKAEGIFAHVDEPRLVLLTCGGAYVGGNGGYQSTVVLVASPVTHAE